MSESRTLQIFYIPAGESVDLILSTFDELVELIDSMPGEGNGDVPFSFFFQLRR